METLQLRLSLAGIDTPEEKLRELQNWLQDAGLFVRLEIEPPAEEEMGGKAIALVLVFTLTGESIHLPPAVEEGLRQIDGWQQQQPHSFIKPVIHLTGKSKPDEEIQETIRREQLHIELREPDPQSPPVTRREQLHIELREPEPPPLSTGKAQVVAPPKPPTGKK
jgi:hypothetical protein